MTGAALDAHLIVDRGRFAVDVALTVGAGRTAALMGPSGAGKSTILAAISGLVSLSGGHVRLDGATVAAERVHVEPARRGVVLLGQDPRLFPHLSVVENVAFGPRAAGVPVAAARASAGEWLRRVGLGDAGARHPAELSGGQQQRVALARALAIEPRVLLLDEPFTSLDVETAADVRRLVAQQLAATRATAVVVSHDADDAVALAGRLLVIEQGLLVQEGTVAEVLAAPATRFVAAVAASHRFGLAATATGDGESDRARDGEGLDSRE
ncbi:ABC transporter ATP-binding protein [Microbacterium hominis]|uniref:ATP-binding cassette domain-containing protein n=1 Tax=Microbacterium hominis TaxID=162426 RepID=A0A7D4Q195_9MICO|nr:ATP-binding cassette domain-containing protein [Microbacterium hominis]QKJ18691.1 ATP-binding cassette domain-containing protein [Microbacterium hominis]